MWIQSGDIEPIVVLVLSTSAQPLTGLTDVKLQVFRRSDGRYFDWNDNTFKTPATIIEIDKALEEISATYSPGQYKLNVPVHHVNGFNTSSITNPNVNDVYFFTAEQVGASTASNLPQVGQLRTGGALDDIVVDEFPVVF